jgi:hypothetical protein
MNPKVKNRCKHCERFTLSRQAWAGLRIVSPTGIMHLIDAKWPNDTVCGYPIGDRWNRWRDQ